MVDDEVACDLRTVIVDIEDKLKVAGLKCSEFDMRSPDVAPWLVALRFIEERLRHPGAPSQDKPECRLCGGSMEYDDLLQAWTCAHPEAGG